MPTDNNRCCVLTKTWIRRPRLMMILVRTKPTVIPIFDGKVNPLVAILHISKDIFYLPLILSRNRRITFYTVVTLNTIKRTILYLKVSVGIWSLINDVCGWLLCGLKWTEAIVWIERPWLIASWRWDGWFGEIGCWKWWWRCTAVSLLC